MSDFELRGEISIAEGEALAEAKRTVARLQRQLDRSPLQLDVRTNERALLAANKAVSNLNRTLSQSGPQTFQQRLTGIGETAAKVASGISPLTAAIAGAAVASDNAGKSAEKLKVSNRRLALSYIEARKGILPTSADLTRLNKITKDLGLTAEEVGQKLESRLGRSLLGIQNNSNVAQKAVRAVGNALQGLGLAGVAAGGALTVFGLKAVADFQRATAGLQAFLPTAQIEAFTKQIENLAVQTPFSVQGLLDLSKQLFATGTAASDVIPDLQTLADAGALFGATEPEISAAVRAFGQLRATSTPLVQDIRQISTAFVGFNAESELAAGALAQGLNPELISGAQAAEILLERLQRFPGAAGAAARQANTLGGAISNLKDALQISAREAFTPLADQLTKSLPAITDQLRSAMEQIAPPLADLVGNLIPILLDSLETVTPAIAGALKDLAASIEDLAPAIELASEGFAKFVETAGDVTRAIGAVVGPLARLVGGLRDAANGIGDFINSGLVRLPGIGGLFRREVESTGGSLDFLGTVLGGIQTKFSGVFDKVLGAVEEEKGRIAVVEDLNQKLQDLLGSTNQLTTAQRALRDAQQALVPLEVQRAALLADTARDTRELAEASDQLRRAELGVEEARQAQLDIEKEFAELSRPASALELEEAQDAVLRAQLRLNDANRDALKAEEKLNQTQSHRINLAGLTLDQIRTQLANLKRSLAAQKAHTKAAETTGKTQAEIEDEALQKELNRRDAVRGVQEAEEALLAAKEKGKVTAEQLAEFERRREEAALDVRDAIRDQETSARALQALQAGDTARAREIKQLDEQIADANERIADAAERVREAEKEVARSRATAIGNEGEILRLQKEQTLELVKQLGLKSRFDAALALLPKVLSPQFVSDLIPRLAQALLEDPRSDIRAILQKLRVPGLMAGGIVTGSGAAGTLIRAGEYGRPEAVLPLTDRFNFARTFADAYRVASPGVREQMSPLLAPQPRINLSGVRTAASTRGDAKREREALAEAIAEALARKGGLSSSTSHDIDINLPASAAADPRLVAWHLERKIRKQLRSR